jgi:hypothetical protein
MFSYIKFVLLIALPSLAWADVTIFDVRKNLPMSDNETVYRDFYLNGGSESGLSVGMVLTVQRRMPLYDSYQNRSAGDLQLKVAKIKIIHVQRGLAVARLHSEFTREGSPLLEDPFIMVGDRLDLESASSDKKADNPTPAIPSPAPATAPEAQPTGAALEKPAETARTTAQITVNSIDLSSQSPKPEDSPLPQKVETPSLQ